MKVLVAGSRSITEFDLSLYIPSETEWIISGGAKGVDTLAEQYADQHHISKMIMRPRYDLYGKAAPIKRNQEMVNMADMVLIVWDGKSKGTKATEQYAVKIQKRVVVVMCERETAR